MYMALIAAMRILQSRSGELNPSWGETILALVAVVASTKNAMVRQVNALEPVDNDIRPAPVCAQ
jgi:hypothetical protein